MIEFELTPDRQYIEYMANELSTTELFLVSKYSSGRFFVQNLPFHCMLNSHIINVER